MRSSSARYLISDPGGSIKAKEEFDLQIKTIRVLMLTNKMNPAGIETIHIISFR